MDAIFCKQHRIQVFCNLEFNVMDAIFCKSTEHKSWQPWGITDNGKWNSYSRTTKININNI